MSRAALSAPACRASLKRAGASSCAAPKPTLRRCEMTTVLESDATTSSARLSGQDTASRCAYDRNTTRYANDASSTDNDADDVSDVTSFSNVDEERRQSSSEIDVGDDSVRWRVNMCTSVGANNVNSVCAANGDDDLRTRRSASASSGTRTTQLNVDERSALHNFTLHLRYSCNVM